MPSSYAVAWTPPLLALLVIAVLLLSSISALAAEGPKRVSAPPPAAVAGAGHARPDYHVATAPLPDASMTKNGSGRRPISGVKRRRRRRRPDRDRGGGTGAWAFSAMLPRGFVPPSGSSACHNDMPAAAAAAAYAQFYACSGSGNP